MDISPDSNPAAPADPDPADQSDQADPATLYRVPRDERRDHDNPADPDEHAGTKIDLTDPDLEEVLDPEARIVPIEELI